jgi:EmrB/QacA subfamily drug resistance transporter
VLCAAQFMLILDVVVVNVALPSIQADLHIPEARLQLTSIAYTLTFGSLLVVFGRVGDLVGRRRLFLGGLAVFTGASLATGLAQGPWELFASRAAQGVGAAMVSPTALALITTSFAEGDRRNRALGIWGAIGSAGAIAGQLLGGVITDAFGWRWIFLVNVPVGVAVMLVARSTIAESRGERRPRLDLGGAVLLTLGLAVTTFTLIKVVEGVTFVGGAALAAAAVALLVVFVGVERRHPEPLVRFSLLRLPGVRTGNLTLALNAGALGGAMFFTTLYLQRVTGYSPLAVGAAFAPITVLVLVIAPRSGALTGRYGARRLLLIGLVLLGLGMLYLARVPADGSYWVDVLPGMVLLALGSGLAYPPTFVAGTSGVSDDDQGLASGLLNSAQELGGALGLAILGSVAAAGVAAGTAGPEALADGYRTGYLAAAGLMALAVFIAWRAPRNLGGSTPDDEAAAPGQRSEPATSGAVP